MAWLLLPHVVVFFATALLSLGAAAFVWRRRTARGALSLSLLMLAVAEWTFAAAVEAAVVDPSAKVLWSQVEYLGFVAAPPLALLFALRYTGWWPSARRRLAALWLVPLLTLALAWTNQWHRLVWSGFSPGDPAANVLVYHHGPAFWVWVAYVSAVDLAVVGLLFREWRRRQPTFQGQVAALAFGSLLPLVGGLAYAFDLAPVPGLDWTPLGCAGMSALFAWSVTGMRLLKVVPIAREALVQHLRDGIVVLDPEGVLLDLNPAARRILDLDERALGRPWRELGQPPDLERLGALGRDASVQTFEARLGADSGEARYLDVGAAPLRERDFFSGWLVTLRDVTQARSDGLLLRSLTQDLEEQVRRRTAELQATVARLEEEVAERRRAEETLRRMEESLAERVADQSRKLAGLSEILVLAGQPFDADEMRAASLRQTLAVVGGDAGCAHLFEPSGEARLAVHEGLSAGALAELASPHRQPSAADGEDIVQRAGLLPRGFAAGLRAPIHLQGRTTGALGVYWSRPQDFSAEDVSLFRAMADHFGVAMESARLRRLGEEAAVRRERRRLARDLHDSVTQSLHSLVLAADTATNRLSLGHLDRLELSLTNLSESARQALKEMRLLLFELRLAPLVEVNLVDALRTRLETVEQRAGIAVRFDAPPFPLWSKSWESDVYRIAMEALNNSLKHARANRVTVEIAGGPGWLTLEVADDGQGFEPAAPSRGGMGLVGMIERAERLGGKLKIESAPGAGARVRLSVAAPGSAEPGDVEATDDEPILAGESGDARGEG